MKVSGIQKLAPERHYVALCERLNDFAEIIKAGNDEAAIKNARSNVLFNAGWLRRMAKGEASFQTKRVIA
jgi:hypothetical protein